MGSKHNFAEACPMCCSPLGQRVEVATLVQVVQNGLDVGWHDLLPLPVVLPQQRMVLDVGDHFFFLQLSIAIVTESTRFA